MYFLEISSPIPSPYRYKKVVIEALQTKHISLSTHILNKTNKVYFPLFLKPVCINLGEDFKKCKGLRGQEDLIV